MSQIYGNSTNTKYKELLMYINVIAVPCIVIIGICGNTLSFFVIVMTHLKYKSSSIYLASLNVVDTGFLCSLLPAWLGWVHVDIFHMEGWCQTTIYAAYVFAFMSVWIVVAFTVERFVVVFYPLKRSVICTTKRALCVIGILVTVSLIIYSYTLWTTSVLTLNGWPTCMSKEQFSDMLKVLSAVDTVITLVLPSVAIIFLNGSIAIKLIIYYRTHSQDSVEIQTAFKSSSSDSDGRPQCPDDGPCQRLYPESSHSSRKMHSVFSVSLTSTQTQRQRNFQNRTTRTLLAISTIFILLNLPSHAFRVYVVGMAIGRPGYNMSNTMHVIQEFCLLLYYANFASNLFLYTLCSQSFRMAFLKLWRRVKRN